MLLRQGAAGSAGSLSVAGSAACGVARAGIAGPDCARAFAGATEVREQPLRARRCKREERPCQLQCRRIALRGLDHHGPFDDGFECSGQVAAELVRKNMAAFDDVVEQTVDRLATLGSLLGHAFVHDHAQRIDIRQVAHLLRASRLFG